MIPLLSSNSSLFLMIAMMMALFYFMIQRPMKKRAVEAAKMADALEPGTRVLLSGGYLGTVLHLGTKQAIVEIAPGVEVTVLKGSILKPMNPADEEFEYADDLTDDDAASTDEGAYADDAWASEESEASVAPSSETTEASTADALGYDSTAQRDGTANN